MKGVSGFRFLMKLSEIVYLYLNFLDIICSEDDLHYLQYIPEDEIGGLKILCISATLTHLNNQAGLLLLGGITDPEAMGRTVPSVKAASLLFYDGRNFIFFPFKINIIIIIVMKVSFSQ